jgi:hypothetical protein
VAVNCSGPLYLDLDKAAVLLCTTPYGHGSTIGPEMLGIKQVDHSEDGILAILRVVAAMS